jgi:hypothetical protein
MGLIAVARPRDSIRQVWQRLQVNQSPSGWLAICSRHSQLPPPRIPGVRKLVPLVALVLVVSACGGTSTGDIQATSAPGSGTAAESSAAPDDAQQADDSGALDFELALSDGSTFHLSDEEKPVYLVFWAEW